jgi:hypothetical protein
MFQKDASKGPWRTQGNPDARSATAPRSPEAGLVKNTAGADLGQHPACDGAREAAVPKLGRRPHSRRLSLATGLCAYFRLQRLWRRRFAQGGAAGASSASDFTATKPVPRCRSRPGSD